MAIIFDPKSWGKKQTPNILESLRRSYKEWRDESPRKLILGWELTRDELRELQNIAKNWTPHTFGWQTVFKWPDTDEYWNAPSRIVIIDDVDLEEILLAADGKAEVLLPDHVARLDRLLSGSDEDD